MLIDTYHARIGFAPGPDPPRKQGNHHRMGHRIPAEQRGCMEPAGFFAERRSGLTYPRQFLQSAAEHRLPKRRMLGAATINLP